MQRSNPQEDIIALPSKKEATFSLLDAIFKNEVKRIPDLVADADLSFKFQSKTPIHHAASLGRWKCVNTIAKNKKSGKGDPYDYTKALRLAALAGKKTTCEILIKAGAETTSVMSYMPENERSAKIFKAIRDNDSHYIQKHFYKAAPWFTPKFNPIDENNRRPFLFAAQNESWACVKELIPYLSFNKSDPFGYFDCIHVLYLAILADQLVIARALLNKIGGANGCYSHTKENEVSEYHLLHIVSKDYPDEKFISFLLKKGADFTTISAQNQTAFQVVIKSKHWSVATLLLNEMKYYEVISALPLCFIEKISSSKETPEINFCMGLVSRLYDLICQRKIHIGRLAEVYQYLLDCQKILRGNMPQENKHTLLRYETQLKYYAIMVKHALMRFQQELSEIHNKSKWIDLPYDEKRDALRKHLQATFLEMTPIEIIKLYDEVLMLLTAMAAPFFKKGLAKLADIEINAPTSTHQTICTTTSQNNAEQPNGIALTPVYVHRYGCNKPDDGNHTLLDSNNSLGNHKHTLFPTQTTPDPFSTLIPVYMQSTAGIRKK